MLQEVPEHCELIFYLLPSAKCDFGEFDKPKFQVVPRHNDHIFCLLTSPKFN